MGRKDAKQTDETMDFRADMRIDSQSLEMEWLRQPGLHAKWAAALADADLIGKKAHERVKLVRSDLIKQAAEGGEALLGMKPTGPIIEAWYRLQPDHQEAKQALIEAEHTRDLMFGAVQAMRQRKDAVENLTRLHLAGYYSNPHIEEDRPITEMTDDPTAVLAAKLEEEGR